VRGQQVSARTLHGSVYSRKPHFSESIPDIQATFPLQIQSNQRAFLR